MLQPKPKFDPNKPFTENEGQKPKFDPNADFEEVKKKVATSPSTTPKENTDLAPTTGSSVSKSTQGFPEIDSNGILPDFDKMKSGSGLVEKPKTKLQKPPVKEETSFFDYLKENLDTGLATVSKSIYDAPGLVYDAAASLTNPIFEAMGVDKSKLASSDKLANDLGFKNIPSEILKEKIKVSNEKINEYASKNGGDALTALENGNYSGAAKLVAGTTAQSLPIMIAAMASGGESTALTAIGVSTASTKNAELKESNPEMKLGTRVTNAATAGLIEAVTGHLFTGASGAVMKKILADKGVEVGSKIISKSFTSTIQRAIEKNPFVGAIGEVVEETAVEFGNQANDIASGIRTEFDIHAIKNAGLSATGMGGINTIGVYGAKGYIKAKDYTQIKSVNKEIFKLQNELSNENLSAENKNIIGGRIDRLLSENKKLLGGELEKLKSLPIETKKELNAINSDFDDIRTKVENINDDASLSPDVRKAMLDELKVRAESAHKRKTEILSQNDVLEVNGDFSNFNGVDPDFDIEKESVNSLPLKEQETLKKQALESLVTELNPDGKKNIKITNEQVVERANEIYLESKANTEPKTASTEPTSVLSEERNKTQTSPPSSSEEATPSVSQSNDSQISNPSDNSDLSEKITETPESSQIKNQEVSPVEDVVATSLEKKVTEIQKKRKEDLDNFRKESWDNLSDEFKKEDGRKLDEIAFEGEDVINSKYDAEIKEAVKNEATPPTNTPTNGNVPVGDQPNDAQGKNNKLQPAVDTKPSEGEVKVTTKKVKSVKDGEFDVDFNENGVVTAVRSSKDGRVIPKFVERNVKPTKKYPKGRKILSKNANYAKIEADAYGELTNNQQNAVEKQEQKLADEKIRAFEPNDEYEIALKYVAEGGKVKLSSARKETGEKNSKAMKWAAGFNKESDLPSIENVAEKLIPTDSSLDESLIREHLIDIFSNFENQDAVKKHLLEVYEENNAKKEEEELRAHLGSLSEKEFAMYEALQAEDSYFEELTDKELDEYNSQKITEYEQGQQEYARAETADQKPKIDTKGNEGEVGNEGVQEGEKEIGNNGELANEVNRTKSLVAERVTYEKATPKNSPKKLPEIIKQVSNALKTTLIYGKSKRGGAGSYNPTNALVRISRAGDIDTVAHELGHLLDDRHDILGTIPSSTELAILAQLKWYSERGGSNPPTKATKAQKAEYLQREGLAEFIRSLIANPTQTKIIAPELLAHFENVVDQKTQAILKDFSQDFLDFANASNIEKTLANVEDLKLPNKNKFVEWLKGFRSNDSTLSFTNMDKFYSEMANSNHFGIKAFKALLDMSGKSDVKSHENFEIMSRVFLGINGKLENIFATGLINAKNEKLKAEGGTFKKDANGRTVYEDGTAMTAKWLIEGLDTTSEDALTKEMNLVIAMGVAERTIEYAKKLGRVTDLTGIGGSVDTDLSVAIGALNEFEDLKNSDPEKYNRIKEGVERYRKMADAPLQYAVDKGRISEEQYKLIKDSNEYYIALNRNIELVPGEDMFVAFGGSSNAIGSAKDIIKKSKGGTETIENPYLSLLANINNIIKESDRNEVMSSFVEPLLNMRTMGDGTPIDFSKIGRLANDGDKNTISVYRKGKLEKWQFEENIYKGLKNIESISSDPILSFFAKPSQLIRWTVTHNPVFYARNIVKDTQARMIISNDHSSLKDMIHNASDRELFELYGGSQAGHLHTGKDSYSKAMVTAAKEITAKGGIIINPMNWGKKYVKFLQSGENINRIAEFNNSYKVAIKQGMSEYDAGLYAAFQARDLMDFAVAGHTMRKINQIVVFSNAGVQSIRKANKSLQRDPFGFSYRTAMYSVLPTVAFSALRYAMGDDDEYEELSDQQRDMFFNFKIPILFGDAWISIPKPYELGLPAALVDRAISKIHGNDAALDGFMGTTIKTIMPFDESSFLGGLKPIVETAMNRNTYTGAAIVPEYESGKLLELRTGKYKASLVGQDVSLLFKQANLSVDPRNIDHIMKGYGTYFASQGMAITDLGKKEKTPLNFWIKQSGFAKDVASYNAKSVKKASDLAVEIGKINSGEMKDLRNKIEEFALETDLKKRKALTNVIYADAKEIVKKYSVEKENAILYREKQIELEANLDAVIKKIPSRELRDNPEYITAKKALKEYNESIKKPSN